MGERGGLGGITQAALTNARESLLGKNHGFAGVMAVIITWTAHDMILASLSPP
jgi:hypothetical protein